MSQVNRILVSLKKMEKLNKEDLWIADITSIGNESSNPEVVMAGNRTECREGCGW